MKRILLIAGFLTIMLQATDFACIISLPTDYKDEKGNLYKYSLVNHKDGDGILIEYTLSETYSSSEFFSSPETLRYIRILTTFKDDRVFFEINPVKSRELLTFKCEEKK